MLKLISVITFDIKLPMIFLQIEEVFVMRLELFLKLFVQLLKLNARKLVDMLKGMVLNLNKNHLLKQIMLGMLLVWKDIGILLIQHGVKDILIVIIVLKKN